MTEPGASTQPPGLPPPVPPPARPLPPPPLPPPAPGSTPFGGAPDEDMWSTTRIHGVPPDRDPTPAYVRRMRSRRDRAAAAAMRPTRRSGPSVGVIAGVIVPILFLLIGTVFIAAALDSGGDPDDARRPPRALGTNEVPVDETAPPLMTTVPTTPPPTTAPPVPETTVAVETTLAPETTIPTVTTVPPAASPDVGQAVGVAELYLAAIVAGDYVTARLHGSEGLTDAEIVDRYPSIVAGSVTFISAGPPGTGGIPLRLLVVTQHDLEGELDTSVTCAHWDVNGSTVTEVSHDELYREPGTASETILVQARADCAALPLG